MKVVGAMRGSLFNSLGGQPPSLFQTGGGCGQFCTSRRTEVKLCIGFMQDWNGYGAQGVLKGSFKYEIVAPKSD